MKILDIKPKAAKFYLKDPITGFDITLEDGTPVYWDVVGNDSSEFIEAQKAFLQELEDMGEDDRKSLDKFDYLRYAQKQTAFLVKGWDKKFNDAMDGEFTQEYVEQILTNPDYKWIYTQLDEFIGKRKNFFLS
jgi:hypothetical protein